MNASSPEMETICPVSSSPCSGVLKFRLASNASASIVFASASSFVWVMGVDCSFVLDFVSLGGEIGWAAYVTRNGSGGESAQRHLRLVSSGPEVRRQQRAEGRRGGARSGFLPVFA